MTRKTPAIVAFLIGTAASALAQSAALDVPAELGNIDYSQTPSSVISSHETGQPVVWLGRVESASIKKENGKVVFEWLCRHLSFAVPTKDAIATQPIRFASSDSGYFVVNLVTQIPADAPDSVSSQIANAGKYILVAGRAQAIVSRGGKQAVFLNTSKMVQANGIAEPIKR